MENFTQSKRNQKEKIFKEHLDIIEDLLTQRISPKKIYAALNLDLSYPTFLNKIDKYFPNRPALRPRRKNEGEKEKLFIDHINEIKDLLEEGRSPAYIRKTIKIDISRNTYENLLNKYFYHTGLLDRQKVAGSLKEELFKDKIEDIRRLVDERINPQTILEETGLKLSFQTFKRYLDKYFPDREPPKDKEEKVAKIVSLYNEGKTYEEIISILDLSMSISGLSRFIARNCPQLCPRDRYSEKFQKIVLDNLEEIKNCYRQGQTLEVICNHLGLGMSVTTLRNNLLNLFSENEWDELKKEANENKKVRYRHAKEEFFSRFNEIKKLCDQGHSTQEVVDILGFKMDKYDLGSLLDKYLGSAKHNDMNRANGMSASPYRNELLSHLPEIKAMSARDCEEQEICNTLGLSIPAEILRGYIKNGFELLRPQTVASIPRGDKWRRPHIEQNVKDNIAGIRALYSQGYALNSICLSLDLKMCSTTLSKYLNYLYPGEWGEKSSRRGRKKKYEGEFCEHKEDILRLLSEGVAPSRICYLLKLYIPPLTLKNYLETYLKEHDDGNERLATLASGKKRIYGKEFLSNLQRIKALLNKGFGLKDICWMLNLTMPQQTLRNYLRRHGIIE